MGTEGGVKLDLCAGPSRITGEIHLMNANALGSTLYRVDGAKVCNLSLEDQSYREKRDKLDFSCITRSQRTGGSGKTVAEDTLW